MTERGVSDPDGFDDENLIPKQGVLMLAQEPGPVPSTLPASTLSPDVLPASKQLSVLFDPHALAERVELIPKLINEVSQSLLVACEGEHFARCRDNAIFLQAVAALAKSWRLEIDTRELLVWAEYAFVAAIPLNPGGRGKCTPARYLAGFSKSKIVTLRDRYSQLPCSELISLLAQAREQHSPVRMTAIRRAAKAARAKNKFVENGSRSNEDNPPGKSQSSLPREPTLSNGSVHLVIHQPWADAASAAGLAVEDWMRTVLDEAAQLS